MATWLLVVLAIITVGVSGVFGYSYIYCLHQDRDALRSESYNIEKLAIQHGVLGDSKAGIIERPENIPGQPRLTNDNAGQE
ncbi:hypothetical protein C8J45_102228 [Sphingomonas sp. PP-CE-3G-477]|uniref:hypothetical protein n=1 Tax=Sphingomonas sp. PP-CE-3G-477 TaxID=2135660 RepID=UPI000D3546D5|nr:hypothetical protein [Sphingomonas sp. PP-CE-3G-477]PTQ64872.1 hypothetical protein C8J45_102228 [Sphingomonas sp. PP-CE-3G-477]